MQAHPRCSTAGTATIALWCRLADGRRPPGPDARPARTATAWTKESKRYPSSDSGEPKPQPTRTTKPRNRKTRLTLLADDHALSSTSTSTSTTNAAPRPKQAQPHNRGLRPCTIRNVPANGSHQFGSRQVSNDEVLINSPGPGPGTGRSTNCRRAGRALSPARGLDDTSRTRESEMHD